MAKDNSVLKSIEGGMLQVLLLDPLTTRLFADMNVSTDVICFN